jgi:hypothetical protein
MAARQEHNMVNIDINVADSRIKDLLGQKEMLEKQILEILTEKRVVDKENLELEFKRQGKGETEADQKHKQLEAELEQAMRLRKQTEGMKARAEHMSTLLAEEEKKAKDLLD